MALRRSRVRIPLGPQNSRSRQKCDLQKVMAGVVSHPVSELGEQGVSPATASNGNAKIP